MDRRYRKTNEAIRQAYFGMLMRKEKKITVAEICRRADIDRKTFYLHFDTIEDIIVLFCREKMDECMKHMEEKGFRDKSYDIKIAFEALNDMVEENRELYKFMASGNDYEYFWDMITQLVSNTLEDVLKEYTIADERERKLYAMFYASATLSSYRAFLCGEVKFNGEELAEKLAKIAWSGISGIMKPMND